jgi:hypothetical protein
MFLKFNGFDSFHVFLLVSTILAQYHNIGIHIDFSANNVETNHIMWPQININIIILMIWPTFYWKKAEARRVANPFI